MVPEHRPAMPLAQLRRPGQGGEPWQRICTVAGAILSAKSAVAIEGPAASTA